MKNYIIDAYGAIYTSYYSYITKPIFNLKGENVSAVFGFMETLLKLIKTFDPENLVMCFDCGKSEYRKELYENYKANRKPMPDDLRGQIDTIKELIKFMGIKIVEEKGFEADDTMAYISKELAKKDVESFILTRDKDLFQLINDKIKILRIYHGEFEILDTEFVINKYGFFPKNIVDYLSLLGDSSDNIKGVRGIGEKYATQLVTYYSTLDNIYESIDSIEDKIKKKLIDGKEDAYFSKKLVELNLDVPIDVDLNDYKFDGIDNESMIDKLKEKDIGSLKEYLT